MTTSGSIDFVLNRDQLIRAAFRKINAFATGETPDAESVNAAAMALNAMVKHWEAQGIHLWTETEGVLWLQPAQYSYPINGAASNRATLASGYSKTTLTNDVADGATSIVVDSTTGFAASRNVGVMLDDGSLFWTTESGAPAGSTITLASGLTDSAAAGNLVFVYATPLERPLRIVGARRVAWNASDAAQIETSLNPLMGRLDYRALPNKAHTGVPTKAFYDPQLSTGYVNVWPAPEHSIHGILFTFYRTIEDFDAAANTPDLPQEWTKTLIWNLALEIAPEYDVPEKRFKIVQGMAAQSLFEITGWDREPESIYFGPSFDGPSGY